MARPYWSGHIQISLVSFGVKLFVATEAKGEIRFHQISRSTGERVRHQKVLASALEEAPGEAAAPVEKDEIVKGYEYTKGQYVIIEPSEIANLRVPSKHTVEITQFVSSTRFRPSTWKSPTSSYPRTRFRPKPSPSSAPRSPNPKRLPSARSPLVDASTSWPSPPHPATNPA